MIARMLCEIIYKKLVLPHHIHLLGTLDKLLHYLVDALLWACYL